MVAKDKLLELEQQNAFLEDKIAVAKARQVQPLNYEQVKAFLYYFANKQYNDNEVKNKFFNSFIYRVVLFYYKVYIFYTSSQQTSTKLRLDKNELDELCNSTAKSKTPNSNREGSNWVLVAEAKGFEPLCRLPDNRISSAGRYDHFDTLPNMFTAF